MDFEQKLDEIRKVRPNETSMLELMQLVADQYWNMLMQVKDMYPSRHLSLAITNLEDAQNRLARRTREIS